MEKELTKYGALFRALGDPHRLQILELLQSREMNGTELLEKVDVVQSTLSHHMKTLCEAGLVLTRKEGKKTYYGAAAGALREGARMLEALAGGAPKDSSAAEKIPAEEAGEEIFAREEKAPAGDGRKKKKSGEGKKGKKAGKKEKKKNKGKRDVKK